MQKIGVVVMIKTLKEQFRSLKPKIEIDDTGVWMIRVNAGVPLNATKMVEKADKLIDKLVKEQIKRKNQKVILFFNGIDQHGDKMQLLHLVFNPKPIDAEKRILEVADKLNVNPNFKVQLYYEEKQRK